MIDLTNIAKEVFTAGFGVQTLTRGTNVIERENWYQVISPNNKTPSANEVIHSALSDKEAHETIESTILQYQEIGTAFKWCTSPYTLPVNMGDILEKYKFGWWPARGMYVSLDQIEIRGPNDIVYEKLNEENIDEYADAFLSGWWLDKTPTANDRQNLQEDLLWNLKNRQAHYFLAKIDGEAAGTAGFFLKKNSAYFVGGTVLKKFRGRGVYRGLLAERLKRTKEFGFKLAVTGARERTSAPILEKLGFQTAFKDRVYQFGGTLPE